MAAVEDAADGRFADGRKITIAEDWAWETGFAVKLSFNGGPPFDARLENPFREKQERELEWYFEKWQRSPFTGSATAERVAGSIQEYGARLFEQIFVDKKAVKKYSRWKRDLGRVEIEVVSRTPGFQAIHWEALWDPTMDLPLAVECSVVRKSQEHTTLQLQVKPSSVLNILLVVARPDVEQDVEYRTISRPLVEAMAAGKLRVNVELLRPGTYEALAKKLKARGKGYYHTVHFDCHGSLLEYERAREAVNYHTDARYGRKRLRSYGGTKAFLKLERDADGGVDLVEAAELAKLLVRHHVPICMLNACQSGKQLWQQDGSDEEQGRDPATIDTSLGSILAAAGLQLVVAMGYTVTVSAAQILMKAMYSHLFDQQPVMEALRLGRLQLYRCKRRMGALGVEINLEDWVLPIAYANGTVDLLLQDFQSSKKRQVHSGQPQSQDWFVEPTYGFVGRDLEIMMIEKMLLRHNVLLLQGMGGTGKTTLVTYLCDWWQMTQFVQKVFYFGYDQRAWTLQQILLGIARQVYGKQDERRFLVKDHAVQMAELAVKLQGENHLLVLDNLESVMARELAIQNKLPDVEKTSIQKFLMHLVQGQTKVILGSRGGEEWLNEAFQENVYYLQGLDPQSRTVLAQRILQRTVCKKSCIRNILQDENYGRLMKLLSGYPLAMEVVLPNLNQHSAGEILTGLEGANIQFDMPSEDKTKSIVSCVEYSYQVMPTKTQQLLVCLAPFKSTLLQSTLYSFLGELQKRKAFKGFDRVALDGAVLDAASWGLLSITSGDCAVSNMTILKLQPVFPYFLSMKLSVLSSAQRAAMLTAFKKTYQDLSGALLDQMSSDDVVEKSIGMKCCALEFDHLRSALEMCVAGRNASMSIQLCLHKYLRGDHHGQLRFAEYMCKALCDNPHQVMTDNVRVGMAEAHLQISICCLANYDHQRARGSCHRVLALYQSLESQLRIHQVIKERYAGTVRVVLGYIACESWNFKEACQWYKQALNIYVECGDKGEQASIYQNLGIVAYKLRDLSVARQKFDQALQIYKEINDLFGQAKVYHNLGTVAAWSGDSTEAHRYLWKSLEIHVDLGDRHGEATTFQVMGAAAAEWRHCDRANEYLHLSLWIAMEIDDLHLQGDSYANLGGVASYQRDFKEARKNYQKALQVFVKLGDLYHQSTCLQSLGSVAYSVRDADEARKMYQQALRIQVQLGARHLQARTYHHLGAVAVMVRNLEEAKQCYQQAFDLGAGIDDPLGQASTCDGLGRLAVLLKNYGEARDMYQKAICIRNEANDRHGIAQCHFRLGNVHWSLGELDDAVDRYHQALDIFVDFDDVHSQGRVYNALGRVSAVSQGYDDSHAKLQRALKIAVDYHDSELEAQTCCDLAFLEHSIGDLDSARTWLARGLSIIDEFQHPGNHKAEVVTWAMSHLNGVSVPIDSLNHGWISGFTHPPIEFQRVNELRASLQRPRRLEGGELTHLDNRFLLEWSPFRAV